ncbi:hypothetical protein PGQ11_015554 [Apiospora arundinis]|uniref:Uncharacterized protein n=1 Tax=Apiospora arundinis TaxID=335852 RepID=A0ABR2HN66_9PEZI
MAYIYQTPIWALPNYQFRYPELFQQQHHHQQQQQHHQYGLEHESNRVAWESYMDALTKQLYGDDYTRCRHSCPPTDPRQLSHEVVVMDHLWELASQTRAIRLLLEELNSAVSALAPADCDCDCDTDPDVLAECDAPGWFHHSDGDEEEDSLERFQCNSCGSDHPHFAAAFAAPPRPTKEEEGEKENEPTEEESKGKGKGKEVKQEQQQEGEPVVPSWVDEVERKVGSESELDTSSGLGSSA